jgi:hypothetical protein
MSEDILRANAVEYLLLISYSLQRALIVESEVTGVEDIVSISTAREII